MPRIYTADNYAVDFCLKCFPNEAEAKLNYNHEDLPKTHYVYMGEHHDYDDTDNICEKCGCKLTAKNAGDS